MGEGANNTPVTIFNQSNIDNVQVGGRSQRWASQALAQTMFKATTALISGGLPKLVGGGGRGEQAPATNYNQSNCNSVLQATIEGEGRMSRETSNLCHKLINHCDSHCGG